MQQKEQKLTGRSSAASSTDSLDSILAQFEVVQAATLSAQPQPEPQEPARFNPFAKLFQKAPFRNLQGRPPRPESQVTSYPYQPKKRSSRQAQRHEEHEGYRSQLLLPVESGPLQHTRLSASCEHRPDHTARHLEVINLLPESPAVSPSQETGLGQLWRPDPQHQENACRQDLADYGTRRSLSLESLNSLHSARSSSPPERGPVTWGQPPRDDLFPLGITLPSLYRSRVRKLRVSSVGYLRIRKIRRPPSPASPQSAGSTGASRVDRPECAVTSKGSAERAMAMPLSSAASSQPSSLKSEGMGCKQKIEPESSLVGNRVSSPTSMSEPAQISSSQKEASAGTPSPFSAAAQHPAPASTSSQDSYSPNSESTSASDYGSHADTRHLDDTGNAQRDSTAAQHSLPTPRKGTHYLLQGPYQGGHQRLYMGAAGQQEFPVDLGGKQARTHLRKRDYESELLERLLSQSMKGPYPGPTGRSAGERLGIWRAIGLPRMAFITIVFLCLALFLLVSISGRLHAQRIMRSRAGALVELAAAPLATLEQASSHMHQQLAAGQASSAAEGDIADPKHHHLAATGTHQQHPHQNESRNETGKLAGLEDGKRHERRSNPSQDPEALDAHKRSVAGLRLLEASMHTLHSMGPL